MSFYVTLPSDTKKGIPGQPQNNYTTFMNPPILPHFTLTQGSKQSYILTLEKNVELFHRTCQLMRILQNTIIISTKKN